MIASGIRREHGFWSCDLCNAEEALVEKPSDGGPWGTVNVSFLKI
jgi:hypothetical protein